MRSDPRACSPSTLDEMLVIAAYEVIFGGLDDSTGPALIGELLEAGAEWPLEPRDRL